MHSHSFQFLPGDAVVTRDIKDSAQAILGWGDWRSALTRPMTGDSKVVTCVVSQFHFFFVLFSWPYKLTDRYKSNKLMIFRVGNTWQSITSQELINLWPSTCKCPQERQFPDQWSRWKSKERGTCITEYLPSEENQQQSQTNLDDPWTWKLSHTGLMRALAQPFSFFYWLFTLW